MVFAGIVTLLLVVLWPGEAHAWGPVTHLVHGSQMLANVSILAPALQEILREHRKAYLYGCVAADIVQAKKYTRNLSTHCPCWPVGWQIAGAATTEREQAFAWGYLSHLAGDVYSHNHFVPVQLVVSYQARTLRHIYWEARFDAAQERDRWRLLRSVLDDRYTDCDRLVERVVERTLFSFRTNKRIFDSVMALQRLEQWQAMMRHLGARSRYPLAAGEVERFNALCVSAIEDLLLRGRESACQQADPTGREALARGAAGGRCRPRSPPSCRRCARRSAPYAERAGRSRRGLAAARRRATTQSRMRAATAVFGSTGSASSSPAASSRWTTFVSLPKPAPAAVTSLATIRSRCFVASLRRASAITSWVSAANPITSRFPLRAARPARMSGVRSSASASVCAVFLSLRAAVARGR